MKAKKIITGAITVTVLSMAGVSQVHAWGFGDVFSDKKNIHQSSGRDSQNFGKNSAGRDRVDLRNSFNRMASPNIKDSRNIFTGTTGNNIQHGGGQVRDLGNGTAKNARFGMGGGNWRNDGFVGNNAGSDLSTGVSLGDAGNTNTYMGNDALNTQVRMKELDTQVELERIKARK